MKELTSLSQLTKSMVKAATEKAVEVKPQAKKAADGADVLAYFGREAKEPAIPTEREAGEAAKIASLEAELRSAREANAKLERACGRLEGELASAQRKILSFEGECGRLRGELKRTQKTVEAEEPDSPPVDTPEVSDSASGDDLLTRPRAFAEMFPGEVREMVIAALQDARVTSEQGSRERRAQVLGAVLAENRSSGELERRREELKRRFKDFGPKTNPRALEDLGFQLVSGRTHWKIRYGEVNYPISKTPSDWRAALNASGDLANRCF